MWKPKAGEWAKGFVADFEPSVPQHKARSAPCFLPMHAGKAKAGHAKPAAEVATAAWCADPV